MNRIRLLVLLLFAATIANAQTTVTIQPLRMGNLTTFNTSAIPTDYIQVEVGGKYGTYKRMVGDNTTPASDSVLVHTSGSRWKLMANKSPTSTAWSNITGKPTLYTSPAEVRNALSSLTGTNRLDTSAIKNLRGITTESDPLVGSHIKAITLQNITDWNASYRTGAGVKSALEGLSGTNRLDASAIKNLGSSPEFRVNGTAIASRPIFNLIAGSNTTITGTDNSGANRVDVTISASGGSGGAVTSVAGRTGDVLLSKSDFGLGSVDNTSDMNKPVSTLTQAALDQRQQKLQFQENGTNRLGAGGAQQINIAGSGVSSTISGSTLTYNISSSGGGMVRHYVSPTDYGVDTTGVSDATTALQNMFNANPSGWIVFPKGRYRVNGTLTIVSNSAEGSNLVIQGYGAKIITSNSATTPVILFNNCMRVSVYGLQVDGTIDFDGWYFGNMQDCYLKDLRFGNQNLDAFDETYWSQWVNCSIKSTLAGVQIHTGISSDLTEFNQNKFKDCRIWFGNYAFAFYGTQCAENLTLDAVDMGYQTIGKLYVQNTLAKASINLIATYIDDDKGFPYDTKGIVINTPVAGSVPNSANIGSFISDIASQANVNGYNGVRVGQRIPTSGYNLLKNGDIRYGVQEISSDWTSTTLTSGTGLFGQYIRFIASSASLPKTAEWTAIAAPISGWYSITAIGRNVDSTACVFASVVDGTEVLYNPVKIDDKTRFVVSTGKVYLTQGQVFKLRLYSQINVANTVDIAYVALSYGLTAQLYLPTHPDAISTPVVDNTTNLFEKGDGGTLSPDITSTSNVAAVVSSSGEDQTGDGTYIRFNPITSADFPVIRFTLKTKYLKSAIRAGFVTFTARVKVTGGYGSTMIAFGSDSAFVTPAQISTGTWQDWRITRAVPSGATKIQIVVTGAAAGTAKDIAFDAVQINLGKTATQWAISPHDAAIASISPSQISTSGGSDGQVIKIVSGVPTWAADATGGGSVTGLTSVANVAALKAVTTATNGQVVMTTGYYTQNDGGQGTYVWNSTSTTTADDGAIIQATSVTTGRWNLIHNGTIDARQYGIKADRSTDNYTQLQRAINYIVPRGATLLIPNGITSFSQKLQVGTVSPGSLPFTETFTIKGVSPTLNAGATDPIYTVGSSLNYTGAVGSTDAIIQVNKGATYYGKFEDFTITSTNIGAATYSMLYPSSENSQHLFRRVHFKHSTRGIGILEGTGTNGEFFTFEKCVFEGVDAAVYIRQGQAFDWNFIECQMKVENGGNIIDIGSSGLGYSLNFFGLKVSNTWTAGTGGGITFLKSSGASGNINFYGGRLEAISTVFSYTLGTANMNAIINFEGVHFDGMGSDATRKFIVSSGGNNAYYRVNFNNCKFSNTYASSSLFIDLGSTDGSMYRFERCDFEGWKTRKIVTNSSETSRVQFVDCREKDPFTGEFSDFAKELKYRLNGLSARTIDGEHAEQGVGIAENLLQYWNFGVNSGAALSPWVMYGSFNTFYEVRKIGYSGVNFVSPHSIQAIFRATSGAYQDVAAATFSASSNTYYYNAIVSTEYQAGRKITFALENSSSGKVYDVITITGNSNYSYPLKTQITLKAKDTNVGGVLRLRIYNEGSDLGIVNIYQQQVTKYADAVFVPSGATAITGYTVWSQSSDMLRVYGRLKIPAKTDETGASATTITDLDNDSSADLYVSTSTNNITARVGGRWEKLPNTDLGTAAPTSGTWPRGFIRYNTAPAEAGTTGSKYVISGWQCVTAGTPGTWVQLRYLTGN